MKASFIKTKLNSIINVTKIVTVQDFELDSNYNFEGEAHDFWEMAYIDKGRVLLTVDGEQTILNQGDVVFIKPNAFHASSAYHSSPNFLNISFECKSLAMKSFEGFHAQVDKSLLTFLNSIVKECETAYESRKNAISIKKLVRKKTAKLGSEQLIRTYLEQFLILLLRSLNEKQEFLMFPSKESMQNHLVDDVKKYLLDRLHQNVKIEEICSHFGYSVTYISKVFHEHSGYTINNWFNMKKISRAKELIREKRYNFTEISTLLAFDNPQYFSRVFKKFSGMTPSEFRDSFKR